MIRIFLIAAGLATGQSTLAERTHMHDDGAIQPGEEIGAVDFRVSCDSSVREDFDRALGLMHHMMYAQARAGFEAIAEADASCAMAHWGIATTLFQPLWPERPGAEALERGWHHIQKAAESAPAAGRERLLVEATAGFFRDPGTAGYWERVERWADGMAEAYAANPGDLDTAALYALSRLAVAGKAEDRNPLHDEAERVLRAVWEVQPSHPGAIHYTIHATDVDGRAENALDMVEAYGRIAPEVPHALHMPSHIHVRLGDWPAVIDWNTRSAEAALRRPVNGAVSHHYIHAIDYLVYAYLQQGEDGKARAALDEAMARDRHQASFISAFHAAALPARFAVERRDWKMAAGLEPRTPDYLPWDAALWAEGLTWYARGLGGVHTGNPEIARTAEARLKALKDQASSAGEAGFAAYIEVDRRILAGWIARHDGDADEAVRLMRSAAELEGTVQKHPVTPGALLPPNEALGELLAGMGRPVEALAAFRDSDATWPGRFNTLLGAARAARAAGDDATAREYFARLLEIAGDSRRDALSEARRSAAQ